MSFVKLTFTHAAQSHLQFDYFASWCRVSGAAEISISIHPSIVGMETIDRAIVLKAFPGAKREINLAVPQRTLCEPLGLSISDCPPPVGQFSPQLLSRKDITPERRGIFPNASALWRKWALSTLSASSMSSSFGATRNGAS